MLIYLLRHGDAVQSTSLHDSERPLTHHGQHQADVVAKFLLRSKSAIDTIFCSPLLRAQQTAQPIQTRVGVKNLALTEYLVPGNDIRQLIQLINANPADSILLVGHEPLLSELTSMFVVGGAELRIEFRKSSLALVETTPPVRKGHGLLKWLVTVEQLELLP